MTYIAITLYLLGAALTLMWLLEAINVSPKMKESMGSKPADVISMVLLWPIISVLFVAFFLIETIEKGSKNEDNQ